MTTNKINLQLQPFKTTNQSYPLVQRTTGQMVELWHKTVQLFCEELGVTAENYHQVRMLRTNQIAEPGSSEIFIEFNGQIVGTVRTAMKNTAFGLKFTIECLKAKQQPSPEQEPEATSSPAEEDGVPHIIDYDRGDGTFVTAEL